MTDGDESFDLDGQKNINKYYIYPGSLDHVKVGPTPVLALNNS